MKNAAVRASSISTIRLRFSQTCLWVFVPFCLFGFNSSVSASSVNAFPSPQVFVEEVKTFAMPEVQKYMGFAIGGVSVTLLLRALIA